MKQERVNWLFTRIMVLVYIFYMGRVSTIDDSGVFGAVGTQIARTGAVTLQDVVSLTGVSVGSLYHRYGSREGLLARAWLDAVKAFQTRFLAELGSGTADAGERAAMATPRFCREEPLRARILVCCRREELLSKTTPPMLRAEIEAINTGVTTALTRFAANHGILPEACRLGLVAYPLGAVRMYLPDRDVPDRIDAYVAAAFRSAISIR